MKDMLLLTVLGVFFAWGYHLMGRLDHFLNTHIRDDEKDEKN